jgi:hypothetical protein
MKPTKFGTLAVAAVIALGAYSAKAAPGVTVNHSALSFTATIITNAPVIVHGSTNKNVTGTTKIGNKWLLDLFAHWDGADRTVEPWKSAKLVIGWDWSSDVLVVDKTGTNVLFDADFNPDQYFTVDFFDEFGAVRFTQVQADPGFETVNDMRNSADFELFDNDIFLPYTDIGGYGTSAQTFKQTWDASDVGKTWSDSESATFPFEGDYYFLDTSSETSVSATITATGSGKGFNEIGWAD